MNYVSLLGRITKDPEVTYTQSGKAYLRFSLAVQREGQKDQVDFINCIAWDRNAEVIGEYFKKGNRILIQGRLSVSTYEKNGEKRYSTDVVVSRFEFIETRSTGANETSSRPQAPEYEDGFEDDDNDFPF